MEAALRSFDILAFGRFGQDTNARVIARNALGDGFHDGFKIVFGRIDEKPLSQDVMRLQRRELILKGFVMFVICADQNSVPVPAAGFGGFHKHEHLTFEKVDRQPTKHSFRKEGRVLGEAI
jgi:hypothetical protein